MSDNETFLRVMLATGVETLIAVTEIEYSKVMEECQNERVPRFSYRGTDSHDNPYRVLLGSAVLAITFQGPRNERRTAEQPVRVTVEDERGGKIILTVLRTVYDEMVRHLDGEPEEKIDEELFANDSAKPFFGTDIDGRKFQLLLGPTTLALSCDADRTSKRTLGRQPHNQSAHCAARAHPLSSTEDALTDLAGALFAILSPLRTGQATLFSAGTIS